MSPENGYLKDLSQSYNEERNKKGKVSLEQLNADYYTKIKERFKNNWKEIALTHSKWSLAFGIPLGINTISPLKNTKSTIGSHTDSSNKENELPDLSCKLDTKSPLTKNHILNALITVI